MEQIRIRANRFRKQGRLEDQDLEEIIRDIKEGSETKVKGDSGSADEAAKDEHRRVRKRLSKRVFSKYMGLHPIQSSREYSVLWGRTAMG